MDDDLINGMSAPVPVGFNAQEADNLEEIEKQFAVKVVQQLQTYWAILGKVKGSALRLTKMDDEILAHFEKDFPEFDVSKPIDEDEMKSKANKKRWHDFCKAYEKKIEDYNVGAIIRKSHRDEYKEDSILGVRMQFYAIEIARNRKGLNDWVYEEAQATKADGSK